VICRTRLYRRTHVPPRFLLISHLVSLAHISPVLERFLQLRAFDPGEAIVSSSPWQEDRSTAHKGRRSDFAMKRFVVQMSEAAVVLVWL